VENADAPHSIERYLGQAKLAQAIGAAARQDASRSGAR
jgi:hypothetical protein